MIDNTEHPDDETNSVVDQEKNTLIETVAPNPMRRVYRNLALAMACLLTVGIIAGFVFKTEYAAIVPGTARDTEPLVAISGTTDYPSEGELLFTTIRLRRELSLWGYLWLKLDDDAEIVLAEVILGDQTPDENREISLQMMADSKDIATAVALEQLGFDSIDSNGVFIVQIVAGAAADGVLDPGDTLRAIDGVALKVANDLVEELGDMAPGDEVTLTLDPADGSASEERKVVLGAKEDDSEAAFLGVGPIDAIEFIDIDPGFDIGIDSGEVGGPSAGLAFTLAILDQLTPGELTGNNVVAVTGTMNPDGSVGSVGGVPQKAAAVRDMGIEYFIVPRALGEEVLALVEERAGADLEIIPVDSVDEALEVLAGFGGDVRALEDFSDEGA